MKFLIILADLGGEGLTYSCLCEPVHENLLTAVEVSA